ncbi:MAG: proprotein convertase P-domain-containing protein, partial [Pirellulales bacterium]
VVKVWNYETGEQARTIQGYGKQVTSIAFVGDTNNAGGDELIVAAGPGGTPHVLVYTDSNGDRRVTDHAIVESFFAYGLGFSGGVYVAAGAVANAGGGGAEIITAPGSGGSPHVKVFTDTNANGMVSDNALFDQYNAYSFGFNGGVRVAVGDTDHGGLADVITGTGPGGGPHVIISDDNADAGSLISDNPPSDQFMAFGSGYTSGVFVAFGEVDTGDFTFNGAAAAIPDNTPAGLTQSIFVPSTAGVIRDLDIDLFIAHTANEQLSVSLLHVPSNTTLTLFTKVGGANDGFIVRLDDAAADDIGGATPPMGSTTISGNFNPEGAALLSVLNTIDASGEWRLTVVDDTAAETGTLNGWSL